MRPDLRHKASNRSGTGKNNLAPGNRWDDPAERVRMMASPSFQSSGMDTTKVKHSISPDMRAIECGNKDEKTRSETKYYSLRALVSWMMCR